MRTPFPRFVFSFSFIPRTPSGFPWPAHPAEPKHSPPSSPPRAVRIPGSGPWVRHNLPGGIPSPPPAPAAPGAVARSGSVVACAKGGDDDLTRCQQESRSRPRGTPPHPTLSPRGGEGRVRGGQWSGQPAAQGDSGGVATLRPAPLVPRRCQIWSLGTREITRSTRSRRPRRTGPGKPRAPGATPRPSAPRAGSWRRPFSPSGHSPRFPHPLSRFRRGAAVK